MSQDNENNADDFDFDFLADDPGNSEGNEGVGADAAVPPADSPFEGFDLPEPGAFPDSNDSLNDTPFADSVDAAPPVDTVDTKKIKKKKEKKPRVLKDRTSGNKEPLGLEGILYLSFGGLCVLVLLVWNILTFTSDTKALGIGSSSVLYYVIAMDIIGLVGIVSVPFLLFLHRKSVDIFKVGLGVSAMALSFGVILLLTAIFRYDFTIKAPTAPPSSDIPVSAPVALPQDE